MDSKLHGVGPVTFSWHPDGTYIATSGQNKVLHVFDRTGARTDEVALTYGYVHIHPLCPNLWATECALEWIGIVRGSYLQYCKLTPQLCCYGTKTRENLLLWIWAWRILLVGQSGQKLDHPLYDNWDNDCMPNHILVGSGNYAR